MALSRTAVPKATELVGLTVVLAVVAFVLASGDYVTTTLVGGTNGLMIGRAIANAFGLTNDYPRGSALAFTMLGYALLWRNA